MSAAYGVFARVDVLAKGNKVMILQCVHCLPI